MSVPVTFLKGVKTARAAQLAQLGIYTVEQLYTLYPRSYEDRSAVRTIGTLQNEEFATVCVCIRSTETRTINGGLTVTNVRVADETGNMNLSIFHGNYPPPAFRPGEQYAFYGKISRDQYGFHMTNPVFTKYEGGWDETFFTIQPVYPLTKGLTQNVLRRIMAEALKTAPPEYETLPVALLQKYHFMMRDAALRNIHFPKSAEALQNSRRRFKFEELFTMQLMLLLLKDAEDRVKNGISFRNAAADAEIGAFLQTLPFTLSEGQERVWKEISENMDAEQAMNRLVLGDVGSGKTILAVLAMIKAIRAGYQAVYMAPTEILAEQHSENIKNLLAPLGIRTQLVSGSLTGKQKKEALAAVEDGTAQCIIGTHALIQPSVKYRKLGLAITDEQHRFGVKQRAMLSEQGNTPDVLVMTATPIPRTLALILYGDMDISVLKSLPRGRLPVKTYALERSMHDRIFRWILRLVAEGRQIYMVYPLIEKGEDPRLFSAIDQFAALSAGVFREVRCGLLHGKMPPAQKEGVMRDFKEGRIKILFSTTVVEVGVDVPNASLMVVENAERFGLAQLHQLRGRVGRGAYQSYCVLFSDKITERMKIMESVSDGFLLSEKDLELRGPGDFFGVEQHGLPPFKIANLYQDAELLKLAGEAAFHVLENRSKYDEFIAYIRKKYPDRLPL
ncbi:MAG: ATP-dependent DNA helicase RecG [Clostridia bacterium]